MDLKLLLEGLKLGNNVNNVNDKERIITYLNQLNPRVYKTSTIDSQSHDRFSDK